MEEDLLGVSTPDLVNRAINRIASYVSDCRPYAPVDEAPNDDFLSVSRDEAAKIVRSTEYALILHGQVTLKEHRGFLEDIASIPEILLVPQLKMSVILKDNEHFTHEHTIIEGTVKDAGGKYHCSATCNGKRASYGFDLDLNDWMLLAN